MPADLAGNVTIKTRHAHRGVLLLTGLLIDPGFEGRLHFYVANVGSSEVLLRPGDEIAAVQFLRVFDPVPITSRPDPPPTGGRSSLGFFSTLKQVHEGHRDLKTKVDQTAHVTDNVLMLGYFVLAATLLGLTLAQIMEFASNPKLVDRVGDAVPNSVAGKLLIIALALSVAWVVSSLTRLFPHRRTELPAGQDGVETPLLDRALRQERAKRQYAVTGIVACAIVVATVCAHVVATFSHDVNLWVIPMGAAVLGGVTIAGLVRFVGPIGPSDINARAEKLAAELATAEQHQQQP